MNRSRPWAQVLMGIIAVWLCFFSGLSAAETVDAQTEDWEYPSMFQFQGTSDEACKLLVQKTGLSLAECRVGVAKQMAGQCHEVYLQDGEMVTTTFTGWDGAHKVNTVKVAFKYPLEHKLAGSVIPADHPTRRAQSCTTGNKDGLSILLPDACKNWSVHQVPLPIATLVCRKVFFSNPVHSRVQQQMNSVWQEDCCCGDDLYLPSFNFYIPDSLESSGYTEECDWEQMILH